MTDCCTSCSSEPVRVALKRLYSWRTPGGRDSYLGQFQEFVQPLRRLNRVNDSKWQQFKVDRNNVRCLQLSHDPVTPARVSSYYRILHLGGSKMAEWEATFCRLCWKSIVLSRIVNVCQQPKASTGIFPFELLLPTTFFWKFTFFNPVLTFFLGRRGC